ncbi:hypothetical protein [Flavobacterium rivuli]|uniref:hypothetical protein n=1 Tax=Flavobacterium rivuli TaxID=498301 RepID=UPI00039B752C|nr:hypothetical protein [Flavobacterium rivuli]
MKRTILTLAVIALLSLTATSCSTDDSSLETKQTSADGAIVLGNGDRDLPKPRL